MTQLLIHREVFMTTKYLDGAGLKYFHDTYVLTSAQITTMINNALSQYQQDIVTVVSALPTTGQKEGILYMVPDATDATKFDTFVWEITDDTTTPPTYGWVQQGEGNATVDWCFKCDRNRVRLRFRCYKFNTDTVERKAGFC